MNDELIERVLAWMERIDRRLKGMDSRLDAMASVLHSHGSCIENLNRARLTPVPEEEDTLEEAVGG